MRKILGFLVCIFMVGCATTNSSSNSSTKFAVGDCLKFSQARVMEAPPEVRAMAAQIRVTVLHITSDGQYVVLMELGDRKVSEIATAAQVEEGSVKTECTPTETKE